MANEDRFVKRYYRLQLDHEIPDENLRIVKSIIKAAKEAAKYYGITLSEGATYDKTANTIILDALVPVDLDSKMKMMCDMEKELARLKEENEKLSKEREALKKTIREKEMNSFGYNFDDLFGSIFKN